MPQQQVEEPGNGNSNLIEKALNGHPVMRFFAVAGASIVAMATAGKVVKEGGFRLGMRLQEMAHGTGELADSSKKALTSYRKIQDILDSLEGVNRTLADPNDELIIGRKILDQNGIVTSIKRDETNIIDSYNIATSQGQSWTYKDTLQRKLVSQARRLPYEAPALYVSQKAVLDPLLGQNENPRNKVNWANPFDVLGDFSYQTLKTLTFNVLPFELGAGTIQNSYRNYAMQAMSRPGTQKNLNFIATRTILGQMGVDFGEMMNKTIRFSHQSLGAFSSMIDDAAENNLTLKSFAKRRANAVLTNTPQYANSGYARRLFLQAKDIISNKSNRNQAIDLLPGPFKGMGSAISKGRKSFTDIGKTYDLYQDVLHGATTLQQIAKDHPKKYLDLLNFMDKGSGTHLEKYARDTVTLGGGGPLLPNGSKNPDWTKSAFYTGRQTDYYKDVLIEELEKTSGLSKEAALKFVKESQNISPLPLSRTAGEGSDFIGRFKFTSKEWQGNLAFKTEEEKLTAWWDHVVESAGAHGISLKSGKTGFDSFKEGVSRADNIFASRQVQRGLHAEITGAWNVAHDSLIAPEAVKALSPIKKAHELFDDSQLGARRNFLIRRSAQRLGISTVDSSGNLVPTSILEGHLLGKGFDPNNLKKLRGFLIDKKEIAAPWTTRGANIFGFRPFSVEEALVGGYFGGNKKAVQDQISDFISRRAPGQSPSDAAAMGRSDLRINKVVVSKSGRILDFGRVGRNLLSGFDKFQEEFQLPLIKLKPFQAGGYQSFRAMRHSPSVIVAPGRSTQPIAMIGKLEAKAAGAEFVDPNFYLYLKSSARASKGRVAGIFSNISGEVRVQQYRGLFRPFTTNTDTMLGRSLGNILGQKDVPSSQYQTGLKRSFDVSTDQENNVFFGRESLLGRWKRRIRGEEGALKNPRAAAGWINHPGFDPSSITPELSEGLNTLFSSLRSKIPPMKALRGLSQSSKFKDLFEINIGGTKTNILDIDGNILSRVARRVLDEDLGTLPAQGNISRREVSRLQQHVRNILRQEEKQENVWDLAIPQGSKSPGLNRRVDELKSGLFDYIIMRKTLPGMGQGFDTTIQDLLTEFETMYMKGAITHAERIEARAAVLSFEFEHARNITFKPGMMPVEHNKAILEEVLGRGAHVQEALADVGSGRVAHPKGFIRRGFSNLSQQVPYEKPFRNNPTGTSTVFMPTFRTAFDRNPLRALKGAAGLSWRDPQAMSGSQVPMTHLIGRLNRYFENFGLGVDETRYKSPVDLFARGFVGKRVLPIYAAGVTALAVDRTIGGAVNEKDKYGNRVYSPYFLGKAGDVVAAGQTAWAGIIPGGQTAEQKRNELVNGEVPIRKGRFWILGNTPFRGGRIQYFRPSWYKRLKSGASFTPEMKETPMERLLFGYDFSPLKPLDPYRREREDYNSRPYPLTGDYFTGPWGPLTGALNATIGRVLKPRRRMHGGEMSQILSEYQPVGESGAYFPYSGGIGQGQESYGGGQSSYSGYVAGRSLSNINAGYTGATSSIAPFYGGMGYANPRGTASSLVRQTASGMNTSYSNLAYATPTKRGQMNPRVVSAGGTLDYGTINMSARRLGFQSQELFGIYGFAAASVREGFGIGNKDLTPQKSVLEPASRGYSSNRSFWNMQIGGLGDLPLPIEGKYSNFEISEIIRRFVPKEPAGMNYINNIPNAMGKRYPWLPGVDYPLANIKSGDPYNAVPDAEMRLPGIGYARTHQMFPDATGKLGLVNVHDILGDIAPWSQEYKYIDTLIKRGNLSTAESAQVSLTRAQVEAMRTKNEFTPYEYKYSSPDQMLKHPASFTIGRTWEWLTHRDTYLNTKLGTPRTAVEDWERNNVYGATFPSWENPIQSFIKPAMHKASQRNPLAAASAGGVLGALFGASSRSAAIGSVIGGTMGLASSALGNAYEGITGDRYIPMYRKQQASIEEYADIFEYVRSSRLASQAQRLGDLQSAQLFQNQANTTMYGMDFDKVTPEKLAMAVPKRKREHFRAMLYAPEEEKQQILSTAPRLERRMLEAAWGMPVEEKPDLREYFNEHELPPPDSDIWTSGISTDTLKIKMAQSLGLDLAQMGYYPQQVQEANLLNPAYPDYNKRSGGFSTRAQIKRFLFDNGISGSVSVSPTPFSGNILQLNAGSF